VTSLYYHPKAIGLAGSKLTFSRTGTTTPQNTYTDAALTVASSNPVVADASGVFAPIYLDPTLPNYRVKYTTSADVLIYQTDDVPSNQGIQQSATLQSTDPFVMLYDTDGTVNSRKFRIRVSGNTFQMQAVNDAESTFVDVLSYTGGVITLGGIASAAVIDGNGVSTDTSTGTFTAALTGMSATTSATFNYYRTGTLGVLRTTSALTGTSNSTSMTLTGFPNVVQPVVGCTVLCGRLCDNGNNNLLGEASFSGGTLTFGISKSNAVANFNQTSTTGFTNSGTKGLSAGWYVIYPLI
jgi:hypothetical protein